MSEFGSISFGERIGLLSQVEIGFRKDKPISHCDPATSAAAQ
jgi:hypothetical protein